MKKIILSASLFLSFALSCAEPEFKGKNDTSKDSAELNATDGSDASIKEMGVNEQQFTIDKTSVKQIDIEIAVKGKVAPPILPPDDPDQDCGVNQNGGMDVVNQNGGSDGCHPMIKCPAGTVLEGKICVPIKCEAGYHILNNACTPIVCPKGEVLVSGKCQSPECPAGQKMLNGSCVVIIECPVGTQVVAGGCLCPLPKRFIDGSCKLIECPTNYKMTDKGCEPVIECKADEKLVNGKCEKIICIETGMLNKDYSKFISESDYLNAYLMKYPATDLIKWTIKKNPGSTQNADFNAITLESLGGMNMVVKRLVGQEYTDKLKGGITRNNLLAGMNAAKAEALKIIPKEAVIIQKPASTGTERIWKLKNSVWTSTTAASKIPPLSFDMFVGIQLAKKGVKYNTGKAWAWENIFYVHNNKLYEVVYFMYALQASNGFDGEFMAVSQQARELGNVCK